MSGLRDHLIGTARAQVVRLESAESDLYDFSAELLDGADVLVYRFGIPRHLAPPRDGQHVYTLHGDRLVVTPVCHIKDSGGHSGSL